MTYATSKESANWRDAVLFIKKGNLQASELWLRYYRHQRVPPCKVCMSYHMFDQ